MKSKSRISMLIATLFLIASLTSGAFAQSSASRKAAASDWPQWRGPQRNGVSNESGLLKEWPKEGPKLLWQLKDIGEGYSTPAVVGTRIYLLSNRGLENEFVQALSVQDGKQVWATRLGNVGNPNQQPSYPASRSTPTIDGELLYALSSDGDLACLETATGKIGGSVLVGDHLYGASVEGLVAAEFLSGKLKWQDKTLGQGSVAYADGHLYLHGENGEVSLVEATPEAYREKGRFTPPDQPKRNNQGEKAWAYPVIANGRLYIRDLGALWAYDVGATRSAR